VPRDGRGGQEGGVIYRGSIRLLSAALVVLGLAMIVVTAVRGGGIGLLLGVLFVAAGAGRLHLLRRRG
jgi:hypothetical protein